MTMLLWAVVVGTFVAIVVLCWRTYRNWRVKQRAEAERFAAFMAETIEAQQRKIGRAHV